MKITWLENTPTELRDDPRYSADKATRDKAWDKWRKKPGRKAKAAVSPEMQKLVDEGYFEKARSGDLRGASYFARLVAYRMNPGGDGAQPGALTKPEGGSNVEGYADDAIVLNNNPSDLFNVVDLVAGSGAPNARPVWNGPLPRRASDKWEAPKMLTAAQLAYLRPGGGPVDPPPPPPPPPTVKLPNRGEAMLFGRWLHDYYKSAEGLQRPKGLSINDAPDWEGVGAWMFDVWLQARVAGKSDDEARALVIAEIQKTGEWKEKHRSGRLRPQTRITSASTSKATRRKKAIPRKKKKG